MEFRKSIATAFLFLLMTAGAQAQAVRYDASPAGDVSAPPPSVLTLRIDPAGPWAIVRKTDGGAFQTSGTMYLYQDGAMLTSVGQSAGVYSITIPFSWNFTSGRHGFYVRSSNNAYNSATVTVTAKQAYKVGIVLFRHQRTIWDVRQDLDMINAKIAAYRPHRVSGTREADLVVELEVPWNETETAPGVYDFTFYQDFARACEEKGIKWTPLLSPHYVPPHIAQRYSGDRITDMQWQVVDHPFLKFSPSSAVWGSETAAWARAFIRAMAYDGGRNHFGRYAAIEEVLIGNEMMYPTGTLTSRDSASTTVWSRQYPGAVYPTTLTTTFRTFRAEQLSYAINAMMVAVKGELSSAGAQATGVSSKLYPYYFPRTGDSLNDRFAGYTDPSLSFLNSNFKGLFAMDMYPKPQNAGCGPWYYTNDYAAAQQRTTKPLYVAEFNAPKESCSYYVLSRSEVSNVAISGFQSYNVRAFVFYAYNPNGTGVIYQANDNQLGGLADALNWIVP
ncbi:MAG: Beta-galactosidase [Acidobacteriota bacterium]|nr:Beta-galactosidase [Acidobacteriota bacterium]